MARYLLIDNDDNIWQQDQLDHEDVILIDDGTIRCIESVNGIFKEMVLSNQPLIDVSCDRPEADDDWEDDICDDWDDWDDDDYDGTIQYGPTDWD